ncbi:MAG: TonB-dependent receptor [Sphingomonas sp.]
MLAMAAALLAHPGAALAQDTPQDTPQAEAANDASDSDEIVVTARLRAESVQDTPLAVTALSGDMIEARGLRSMAAIANSAPNVQLQGGSVQNGKSSSIFIRGIGQQDANFAYEGGVGFYVDDVYHGTLFGSVFNLGDIERVEVLRGPQGTLFGKNNEGGAIRIYHTLPKGDNSGFVQGGFGSRNYGMVRGAIDLPITDALAVRVSGGAERYDGYIKRYDWACLNPGARGNLPIQSSNQDCSNGRLGGSTVYTGRVALRWRPAAGLDVNLSAEILDDSGESSAQTTVVLNPSAAVRNYSTNVLMNPTSGFYTGVPIDARFLTGDPYTTYAGFTDLSKGRVLPNVSSLNMVTLVGKVDWDTGIGIHVASITGYETSDGADTQQNAAGAMLISGAVYAKKHEQFSEELRLSASPFNGFLDVTAGLYYFEQDNRDSGFISTPASQFLAVGSPAAPLGSYGLSQYTDDPYHSKMVAAYVHTIVNLTDAFSVEGGLRYNDEKKSSSYYRLQVRSNPFNPSYPGDIYGFCTPNTVMCLIDRSTQYKRWDWKLGAKYQWTPRVMTYVQAATGFKGGGTNPRPSLITQILPFEPEELTTYEAGLKTEFLDRRVRFNAAVFQSDYTNLQVNVFMPPSSVLPLNAGSARIRGLEGELEIEPVDGLTLNGAIGYLKFKYLELGNAAYDPTRNANGIELTDTAPYMPDLTASAGIQYAIETGVGTVTPRIDYRYTGGQYFDPANTPQAYEPSHGIFNAQIAWKSGTTPWSATLSATNLTKSMFYLVRFHEPTTGTVRGAPVQPRSFLLTVRRDF